MRTTLDIADDVLHAVKERARREKRSAGDVLSELARATLLRGPGSAEVAEGESFRVGERVRLLPNHACVVANLHDRLHVVRGETIEDVWRVAARGRVD